MKATSVRFIENRFHEFMEEHKHENIIELPPEKIYGVFTPWQPPAYPLIVLCYEDAHPACPLTHSGDIRVPQVQQKVATKHIITS